MGPNNMQARHKIGDKVKMTADALENYGEKYAGDTFTVTHVSTRYMPADEFFSKGKPAGYHPGYDESAGCALYDLRGLGFSLYEWEVK